MKTAQSALLAVGFLALALLLQSVGQESSTAASIRRYEYATIRWAGKENTHLIRPGGQVEFIGPELRKVARPDRADERSFYMNAAVNGLAKDGWEFAGMTSDEIVMRRALGR